MIHALLVGAIIYFSGLAITAGFMAYGSRRDPDRPGRYDLKFLGCGLVLWPITLPVVLSLLVGLWGPREVNLDEESVDL
jgi:hypothetical protein